MKRELLTKEQIAAELTDFEVIYNSENWRSLGKPSDAYRQQVARAILENESRFAGQEISADLLSLRSPRGQALCELVRWTTRAYRLCGDK